LSAADSKFLSNDLFVSNKLFEIQIPSLTGLQDCLEFVPFDLSARCKQADRHGEERHTPNRFSDRCISFRWGRIKVAQGLPEPDQNTCKSVRSARSTLPSSQEASIRMPYADLKKGSLLGTA
jgi:hypothetical protein